MVIHRLWSQMCPVSSENGSSTCSDVIALASVTSTYNCCIKPSVFGTHIIYLFSSDKAPLCLDTVALVKVLLLFQLPLYQSLTSLLSKTTGQSVVMLLPLRISAGDSSRSQICNGKLNRPVRPYGLQHFFLHHLYLSLNNAI